MTRRMIVPLIFGIAGVAVLVWLGTWQMQRLAWKEAILAEIDTRMAAAPVEVPASPTLDADRFLPVTARGTITADEVHVLVSVKQVGPAYRVISRFETEGGRALLLDRGFIPTDAKDAKRDPVEATITGLLHWPDDRNSSTPANDTAGNIWFARDVEEMAKALGTEPVLIILDQTSETDPPVTPLPLDTTGIPNDHLEYAITWYSLALIWAGMTLYLLWRIKRRDS